VTEANLTRRTEERRLRGRAAAAALAAALLALAGCQFGALGRDLRTLDQNGYLRGTLRVPAGAAADPVVVVALRPGDERGTPADWLVLARPGPYFLVVPVGEYRVGAFVDRNHSLTHDPGEPVAWARGGEPVEVRPGATTAGLDLALRQDAAAPAIAAALPARASAGVDGLPASRIGELVTLEDARFSNAAASIGLWRPVEFLVDIGAGIYFLEPYDPERTPVLFVHGALGHPGNWRTLAAGLDRNRFQAWFAYYPSAVRLEIAAAALRRWLQALEIEYDFPRLVLIAHSMGGLVSRAYLGDDPSGLGGRLEQLTFVSIATPWNGHPAAAFGAARAPVAAPAWFDLSPGSPFLTTLFDAPLPPYATHDLFFAYGGSRRRRTANDGVVTVKSQLPTRVQQQARRVMGFDDGHAAVLDSPVLADELWRSLADVEPLP